MFNKIARVVTEELTPKRLAQLQREVMTTKINLEQWRDKANTRYSEVLKLQDENMQLKADMLLLKSRCELLESENDIYKQRLK